MYTIYQGESLLIPATVVGDKGTITSLTCEIKASSRGEVPSEDDTTVATLSYTDYTSGDIVDGYLFSLANTSALTPGIYYVNYKCVAAGLTSKGVPYKVVVKPGVI